MSRLLWLLIPVLLVGCGGGGDSVRPQTPTAPSFTERPADATVRIPNRVSFRAVTTGTQPVTFAWSRNGQSLTGGTDGTLALTQTQDADAGLYRVIATNAIGSATAEATLVLKPGTTGAPQFFAQPEDRTVTAGSTLRMEVDASGTGPLIYRWTRNGTVLPGVDGPTFEIKNAAVADSGAYQVTVQGAVAPEALSKTFNVLVNTSVTDRRWSSAGSLQLGRVGHAAVRLADGRVAVLGGTTVGGPTNRVEIYSPSTNSWTEGPALLQARTSHSAALLPSGQVLVIGGSGYGGALNSTEFWSPTSLSTNGPLLATARMECSAALLGDGSVAVGGGSNGFGLVTSVERLVSGEGAFRIISSMAVPRRLAGSTLMQDGSLMLAGGYVFSGATSRVERLTASGSTERAAMLEERAEPVLLTLKDGRVVALGGLRAGASSATSEVFAAATNVWKAGPALSAPRSGTAGTVLADGLVLVAGGTGLATCDLLDLPADLSKAARITAAVLAQPRGNHTLTLLADGSVLAVGGQNASGVILSAERWK